MLTGSSEKPKRVALTPETAGRIQKLGYEIQIQSGAGEAANFSDEAYRDAGVEIAGDAGTFGFLDFDGGGEEFELVAFALLDAEALLGEDAALVDDEKEDDG